MLERFVFILRLAVSVPGVGLSTAKPLRGQKYCMERRNVGFYPKWASLCAPTREIDKQDAPFCSSFCVNCTSS